MELGTIPSCVLCILTASDFLQWLPSVTKMRSEDYTRLEYSQEVFVIICKVAVVDSLPRFMTSLALSI